MNSELNDRIESILVKCIQGIASDSEYKEAYDWIHLHEENKKYFDSLYSAWLAAGLKRDVAPAIEQNVWERVNYRKHKTFLKNKSHNQSTMMRFAKIAALFIIVFLLGIISHAYFGRDRKTSELFIVEAPKGAKSRITLADGTHVWLNADSKIQYASTYNKRERDIYLTGEAYFEVAKNKTKPFKVHAGGITVHALGTVFNVKAYPEEKSVETTLVEGLISIEIKESSQTKKPLLLKPNQHAVYYKTQDEIKIIEDDLNKTPTASSGDKIITAQPGEIVLTPKVETEVYTSWKDKRWVFHSESFGDFALKLERLYDIPIIIENTDLKEYKLTGSIEEENIEMVLKALKLIIPIEYRFENKQLIIKEDKKLKNEFDQILKKQ